MLVRCRECRAQTNVVRTDAPAVHVCAACDASIIGRICPQEVDTAALDALRLARRHSVDLFARRSAGRRVGEGALWRLAQALAEITDDEAALFEPRVRHHFGMTLTDMSERLSLAVAEGTSEMQNDARFRVSWFALCVAPLYDWWVSQGWEPKVRIPDAEPGPDENSDGANSSFAEFLIYELGKMNDADARHLASAASVKKLDRAVRDLGKSESIAP